MLPILDSNGNAINLGRALNNMEGFTGVGTGATSWNGPVNRRFHRLLMQCVAVNYTGGTALATVKLTGTGNNDLTVTPTVVNGAITAVAVVAGGTGYSSGATITITDATGTGFIGTVTQSGGVVSAVAVTSVGTASPINPATIFGIIKVSVNSQAMRDISAAQLIQIAQANGLKPQLGELPVYFTEPWRNLTRANKATSWDLFGQSSFQVILQGTNTAYQQIGVTGVMSYDFGRNSITINGAQQPYLEPVTYHTLSYPVAASSALQALPVAIPAYPITRIWLAGSSPGNITAVQVKQDGGIVHESTFGQMKQQVVDYGFNIGQPNYENQNQTSQKPLGLNPLSYFDYAIVFDEDQRYEESLKVKSAYSLLVASAVAQQLTIIYESLPGAYRSN